MSLKKVCIIDDDKVIQFTSKKMIELTGMAREIISFTDGEKAYEYFMEHATQADMLPDIMMVDINMPYIDGWEFLKRYEQVREVLVKKVIIYMVSSSISEEETNRAKAYPDVVDFLIKPVPKDKYLEILQ
jgi:two-component system, chemotaxis family, chemotaxis protein CheY